ncbi:protein translocase subunit SecF [Candidatus Woesearchaeota archaeon]|nr:protein translocase subunit SecF [Candidatus Woesearchaeota archaeon]
MNRFEPFYFKHYKKFTIIPVFLLLLAIGVLFFNYVKTGDIIDKDVSLKGGLTITVATGKTFPDLENYLKSEFKEGDFSVRQLKEFGTDKQQGLIIEASNIKEGTLKKKLEEKMGLSLTQDNYSVEEMGSSLGESFYKQMITAILLAFILMAVVVAISFRTFIPSFAVIFSAFTDMVVTLAIISVLDFKLSTAGLAALLLLIGYSIDTDILLTTKVLKRRKEGEVFDRMVESMKTGLTMTATTIVALLVGYLVSNSFILKEMFAIIIIGLLIDVLTTYLMNAGVLVWYVKRKHG